MSRHRGVFLIKPNPTQRHGWKVRFKDPDTHKMVKQTLPSDPVDLQANTKKAARLREDFCVRLRDKLDQRKRALTGGAVRMSGTRIEDALQDFYATIENPRTAATYREGTDPFRDWLQANEIHTLDDLRRGEMVKFRDALARKPWAPATFNKRIRACKTFVGWAIDHDLCPKLHHDDLRRVKLKRVETELRGYNSPSELQAILEAAMRHDADTYSMTRREKGGAALKGGTPRYTPIAPFVLFTMLGGARLSEAVRLTWDHADLNALNENGEQVGEIQVPASIAKTKKARTIGLEVSPLLRRMLITLHMQSGGLGTLCGVTRDEAIKAMRRLRKTYGAPEFSWQGLRRSCSTYLTSSPGIYGAASVHLAASQLGHSVKVAQAHYTGSARGLARDAHTLEDAMQITERASRIVDVIATPSGSARVVGIGSST